jgi:hypothetical protein
MAMRFRLTGVALGLAAVAMTLAVTLPGCGSRTGLLSPLDEAPPIDAALPPLGSQDATFPADAAPSTLVRVLVPSSAPEGIYQYGLAEFDPASGAFSDARTLSCIATVGDRPVALACACDGTVYVQFLEGSLWVVSPGTFDCAVTPFDFRSDGLGTAPSLAFGIDASLAERLYFFSPAKAQPSPGLFGTLDRTTWRVAQSQPMAMGAQVHSSANASGEVYLLDGSSMWQLDAATGARTALGLSPPGTGATTPFVVWRSAFYFFDIQSLGTTDVLRWNAVSGTSALAGQTSMMIVAAGAPPCVPQ